MYNTTVFRNFHARYVFPLRRFYTFFIFNHSKSTGFPGGPETTAAAVHRFREREREREKEQKKNLTIIFSRFSCHADGNGKETRRRRFYFI